MAPGARLLFLVLLSSIGVSHGAIHTYNKEYFYQVGDACIFKGGSEGLYASTPEVGPSIVSPLRVSVVEVSSKAISPPFLTLSYTTVQIHNAPPWLCG